MSIRVAIEHRTVYRYDRPVQIGPHVIRLRPAPHTRTPILAYSLRVTPEQHFLNWLQDPAGNHLARCVFPEPATELSVTVDLIADMTAINPFDFFIDDDAQEWPFTYPPALHREIAPYLEQVTDPSVLEWVRAYEASERPPLTLNRLLDINRQLAQDVGYSLRMDPGVQTPQETLTTRIGSCRDSAWLLVMILRSLGLAARFASGYLVQLAQDKPAASDKGENVDFTDLHAWAEVYVPGAGWIGLDATSGLAAGEGHIPLACSAEPAQAAPIEGAVGLAQTTFEYSNTVRRIEEPPRVTLPYTPQQWQQIDAFGREVDESLAAGDVRLTMGGEPTFVFGPDAAEPEWNTTATGGRKEELATKLSDELAREFAPGAVLMHEQGKWYPGEPLPRWQRGVYWRLDGEPLWNDPALLASPFDKGKATIADAEAVAGAIAAGLGLPDELVYPAYEDPIPAVWRESMRAGDEPVGDPPQEPAGAPRGFALPLGRDPGDEEWSTGHWHLRRDQLYLVEGDSPMGLRLPLKALAWRPKDQAPDQSLFRRVDKLRSRGGEGPGSDGAATATATEQRAVLILDPPPITALCVELNDNHVHVFLPPLKDFEHAVELLGVVEAALVQTGNTAVIGGYAPPHDVRSGRFVVGPDPGVIEVNIHPSASWPELVQRTETLHEAADRLGLRSDKFTPEGHHIGSGGGSHITLGGATPAQSPLLRNPALLMSMLTYWQHHPALSYLFAGRFIGPTSQAPRVDEARHENLYELEVAFQELARLRHNSRGVAPSWQVDRALRNVLTDLTGNTHRAEFCIDKMYNPGSESGRLGVLELRSFEMPPHPQMSLVQALIVRALVARLWHEPYRAPLVRWGTDLHDRFMLPWFVESDIRAVVDDLNIHGFAFEHAWLAPFLEFRFPPVGSIQVDGVRLELRTALEPWHVLGEETSSGATSRYVDSSLERLQVKLDGLADERHIVTCNGFEVPLQSTDTPGTFVAGVRFRAWKLHSSMHPTIPAHAPLTFDVIDRWSGRSLGGCRYHVAHPGGRAYDTVPVNAAEAASRRAGRFEALGHTPGTINPPAPRRRGEYPRTLDLRRP